MIVPLCLKFGETGSPGGYATASANCHRRFACGTNGERSDEADAGAVTWKEASEVEMAVTETVMKR